MSIDDDELLLYHFREGLAPGEAERIERAIAQDSALAARYRSLADDLERLRQVDEATLAPGVLGRWRLALDKVARPAPKRPIARVPRFAAAAFVIAAGIGVAFVAHRAGNGPAERLPQGPLAGVSFERALQWHLLELQSQLELASDLPAAERANTIRRLAQQNRLQTAVAERAGGRNEARVLRAFTVALEEMTADPAANGDFHGVLAQLDFEVKVMQARLASSSPSTGARALQAL
jgi:hypothetical protein